MDALESGNPALSRVADDLDCPDADLSQYIQDVNDAEVQDLDYSVAIQEYTPDNGLSQLLQLMHCAMQ